MENVLNKELDSIAKFYIEDGKEDDFVDFYNKWSDTNYSMLTDNQERMILFGFAKNLVTLEQKKVQDAICC